MTHVSCWWCEILGVKECFLQGTPPEDFLVVPKLGHSHPFLSEFAPALLLLRLPLPPFPEPRSTLPSKLISSPSSAKGLLEQRSQACISLRLGSLQYPR